MKLGAIFSPVHQGQQQLIGPFQLGRAPESGQFLFEHLDHQPEGLVFNTGQTFEVFVTAVLDILVSHVPILAHFLLLQEV